MDRRRSLLENKKLLKEIETMGRAGKIPTSGSKGELEMADDLLDTPSFYQEALVKYNIPQEVLAKTGVTSNKQSKRLIELTLNNKKVKALIVNEAKRIQAARSGKGGETIGFNEALEESLSTILNKLYDSGRVKFEEGKVAWTDSITGL